MATESYELTDRYLADDGQVFLTGIQALARLPLDVLRADRRAGLRTAAFISGYQGSPLGGYGGAVEEAARLAPDLPVTVQPGLNEELAASSVMGSQLAMTQPDARYDGVLGIWYGKAPGVDRAADALRHAVYSGTSPHGGVVAIVGDDPAAKSSTVPSSSAGLLFDMHVPVLYPGDAGEALLLGRHAATLSRTTGLWAAVKIVADVADATASVELRADGFDPVIPTVDGTTYVHHPDGRLLTPHTLELEQEIIEVRYELATRYASANRLNEIAVASEHAWIGILSSGITYREVREALGRLGLRTDDEVSAAGVRLLKMGMPLPFDPETVRDFAAGLVEIFVVEEKSPNLESLVKDALYASAVRPRVVGKFDDSGARLVPMHGALDADSVTPLLRRRLGARLGTRLIPEPPRPREHIPLTVTRTPFYCSGCPHNRSTEVPEGALVGAGIGCHTMALLMDPDRVGDIAGITCMGNEGAQWIGMSPFVERAHFFQNVGDGTYFHSAQLAVQAAIAAGVRITYKLLYNGTVAMTGGQDPEGQLPVATVAKILRLQGVSRIIITTEEPERYHRVELPDRTDVWGRERLIEAQEALAEVDGVTVLIHDQACAAEARRARKRGLVATPRQRVVINERLCEGCGDCGQVSNCLSVEPVETFFGRKTRINQTTCNLDYSCLEGDCPSFMTVTAVEPGGVARLLDRLRGPRNDRADERTHPADPPSDLPSPTPMVPQDDFAMRITGIGGTGVVTSAQVLGTAAMLDGFEVRGLDQIGLSQKAGPVVSDLRLSRHGATATNRLGEGQADLLLAFDQLVAASDKGLLTCDAARTTVVGSTSDSPTGAMITHHDLVPENPDELAARIAGMTRSDVQHWFDAEAATSDLLGRSTTANVFVIGMAVQAGCVPVAPERIEEAIALNGVAVGSNVAAFRWGRCAVADPERLEVARAASNPDPDLRATTIGEQIASMTLDAEVRAVVARLADEVERWGDHGDRTTYLARLEHVAIAERATGVDSSALLEATARGLHKLTTYKDEYEVARLMVDSAAEEAVARAGVARAAVAWKLHPPLLRTAGMQRKISISTRYAPAMRVLARAKALRGSLLDPFRWAEVRRVERRLAGEYWSAIEAVLPGLDAYSIPAAVRIAELAQLVRGYESIKLANVERFRGALAEAARADVR